MIEVILILGAVALGVFFAWAVITSLKKDGHEYRTVWGNDRRAKGPLEMRRYTKQYWHRRGDAYEWRYNGSEWSKEPIPGKIAALFD